MPALSSPSKPRRWGLWAPYLVVLLAVLAWSLYWLALKLQIEERLDHEADTLRAAGYEVVWADRRIQGYPFRFELELKQVRLAEPSGWGLSAPALKGAAAAYKPDHWVFVAQNGLRLSRPAAGEVEVKADVLRVSLSNLRDEPRLSFEGRDLAFAPRPGAKPFPLTAAKLVEFHLRPVQGDRSEVFWRMQDAQTRRTGVFAQIAPLAPLNVRLVGELSRRSAFHGRDWRDAVRAWTDAGGEATVKEMTAGVGEVALTAQGGPLTVGYDGRLRGDLAITLKQGAPAIAALAAAQAIDPTQATSAATVATVRQGGFGADLRLSFLAGMTTLGPVRIGPAPRIY